MAVVIVEVVGRGLHDELDEVSVLHGMTEFGVLDSVFGDEEGAGCVSQFDAKMEAGLSLALQFLLAGHSACAVAQVHDLVANFQHAVPCLPGLAGQFAGPGTIREGECTTELSPMAG